MGDGPRERLRRAVADGRSALGEREMRALLPELGFGPARTCAEPGEVAAAAREVGLPVVVKALPSGVLHKSDLGLVHTGCETTEDAVRAARRLLERAATVTGERTATVTGERTATVISVQRQLEGIELAVGARRDPLGAVCVVAAGGTLIELLQDTAVGMAPLDAGQARALVRELRIAPALEGYRGAPPLAVDALVELIVAVSELVATTPEIEELDLNPVFVSREGCAIADARCVLTASPAAEGRLAVDSQTIARMLNASTIAVIGASSDELKVGSLIVKYLRKHGWGGRLIAISRSPLRREGVEGYTSLDEVEGAIDLACIAVPASTVADAVADCVARGIPAGVIFSAGFSESGADGAELERRVLAAADGRFRFVGPNSIGVASPASGVFASFGMALESSAIRAGSVAFVSQSGAIVSSLISRGREFDLGFSHWISVGNEADLGVEDFISYLAADPATSVICLFIEVIRRPRAFASACAQALSAGKPVIAIKAGRSDVGKIAALSHTGALTGASVAYDAFLERCAVHQVRDLDSLWAAARGVQDLGRVAGPRVAIVSMSGGACSLLADACAEASLRVPELSAATQAQLRGIIPSFGGVRNPIDVTATGINSPGLVASSIDILRRCGEVDLVLLQLSTNADPAAERMARDLVALRDEPGIPFIIGRLGSPDLAPAALAVYREHGIHVFTWPGQLVESARAAAHLADRAPRSPVTSEA